mgnify:FL=1
MLFRSGERHLSVVPFHAQTGVIYRTIKLVMHCWEGKEKPKGFSAWPSRFTASSRSAPERGVATVVEVYDVLALYCSLEYNLGGH